MSENDQIVDVEGIHNPARPVDRHGIEFSPSVLFHKPCAPPIQFQQDERIPINIKNPDGSIKSADELWHDIGKKDRTESSEHFVVEPRIENLSTVVATEDLGSCSEEDESLLDEAVSEPVPFVPEEREPTQAEELIEEVIAETGVQEEGERVLELSELFNREGTSPLTPMVTLPAVAPEPDRDSDSEITAGDLLKDMQETYVQRGRVYGNSCVRAGKVLKAMIPEGVIVETEEDFAQMAVLGIMAHKICRALNPTAVRSKLKEEPERKHLHLSEMGHQDSIHDLAVYTAIWEELYLRAQK